MVGGWNYSSFCWCSIRTKHQLPLSLKHLNDNELVEVTTQACGIQNYGNTTVKLTREQYAEVGKLFHDLQTKMDSIKTIQDALPIYYSTVVELNKYGLLPEGMNIETAQKLVTGGLNCRGRTNLFMKSDTIQNALCLIFGNLTDTGGMFCYGPLMLLYLAIAWPIVNILSALGMVPIIPLVIFMVLAGMINLLPAAIMSYLKIGDEFVRTKGKIITIGILGVSSVEGSMGGRLVGFTGLKYQGDFYSPLWLFGFALYADIDYF